jgi:hypothetical protein
MIEDMVTASVEVIADGCKALPRWHVASAVVDI